jgi:hypothetical protein
MPGSGVVSMPYGNETPRPSLAITREQRYRVDILNKKIPARLPA